MENFTKGIEFQEHCKSLLQKLGFTHVELTRQGGDQGADILGTYENTQYPIFKGIPPRFTKEEFVVLYLLVNKLLEIHRHGTPPETWAIRHALLFDGDRVISQPWSETLFRRAEHFKQALESNDAQNLKKTFDDLIEKYTKSLEKRHAFQLRTTQKC